MNLAVIGLGHTGQAVAKRLLRGGHKVVAYDLDDVAISEAAHDNAVPAGSLEDVVAKLVPPRIFWLALAAGETTESVVLQLIELAAPGDMIVDGSNGFFKDDIRRNALCLSRALHYVDVGLSWAGSTDEFAHCLMTGGEAGVIHRLAPILNTLSTFIEPKTRSRRRRHGSAASPGPGYTHAGSAGAGHFVMMVLRGIEASITRAYGEGLTLIRRKGSTRDAENDSWMLNIDEIAQAWRRDRPALAGKRETETAAERVFDDCRRTVELAIELGAHVTVLAAALSTTRPIAHTDDQL